MPSAPIVTWARIFPLLAAVTPRSRYLKKERRPATRGAVVGVAYASLPGGFTAAGCPLGVLALFIMEASSEFVPQYYPIHAQIEVLRWNWPPGQGHTLWVLPTSCSVGSWPRPGRVARGADRGSGTLHAASERHLVHDLRGGAAVARQAAAR